MKNQTKSNAEIVRKNYLEQPFQIHNGAKLLVCVWRKRGKKGERKGKERGKEKGESYHFFFFFFSFFLNQIMKN